MVQKSLVQNEIEKQASAVVQKQLEAYNARDVDTFVSCYSTDVEVLDFPSGELICRGKSFFTARYRQLFEENPRLCCTLLSRIVIGNRVVDEESVAKDAQDARVHAAVIYEVIDEQICRVWFIK